MPRQANGTYVAPANTAAVGGTTISSSAFNTLETDIGTEITNSVDRGGRSSMTAALPMGNQKITGMADPTVATDGATKNYVDTATAAFFSTGDIKPTLKTLADAGWVMGGQNNTIGNAGSSATYANANAQALFTLIWNNISSPTGNAFCPVIGGLGASAAADWAGLKQISTGWYAGHALGIAGPGFGSVTTRTLGSDTRNEASTLVTANLPPYTPSGLIGGSFSPGSFWGGVQNLYGGGTNGGPQAQGTITINGSSFSFTGTAQGGTSTPVSIIQPTIWVNVMIKL